MIKQCIAPPPIDIPRSRGIGFSDWLWTPGQTINIAFLDGTDEQKEYTEHHARFWLEFANLEFNFESSLEDSDIRISFAGDGAWSYIGTIAKHADADKPTMNLGFLEGKFIDGVFYDRIVIHEVGHALGLIHGHTHPDANIPWSDPREEWTYEQPPEGYNLALTEYDPDSVMTYPVRQDQTIGHRVINLNFKISNGDGEWMRKYYPGRGTTTMPPKQKKHTIFMPVGRMG